MKKYFRVTLFLFLVTGGLTVLHAIAAAPVITTVAGIGSSGFSGDNGLAKDAQLASPTGVELDEAGDLYIADRFNHRIRKVIATTGVITTVAGSGLTGPANGGFSGDNGLATNAQLNCPSNVVVDLPGNLYIADTYNNRVRMVITATNIITTVAGDGTEGYGGDNSLATEAQLQGPTGVAIDGLGNLYIADANNNRIRKVIAATGTITTVVGSGPTGHASGDFSGDGGLATEAQLNYPSDVAVDGAGNLYIADSYNHRIRQVIGTIGVITTVVGSGPTGPGNGGFSGDGGLATAARLDFPTGVVMDGAGNLYIADNGNHRIRKVIAATGVITTVAGTGVASYGGDNGPAIDAQLNLPAKIAFDGLGNLYIADQDNHRVRRIEGLGRSVELFLPIILKSEAD
jgi:sugar lactone lactonase YvrE